jgi:hypothetical protein
MTAMKQGDHVQATFGINGGIGQIGYRHLVGFVFMLTGQAASLGMNFSQVDTYIFHGSLHNPSGQPLKPRQGLINLGSRLLS